ncbi:hypothetical protein FO519_003677 [Halicephalobus sp. NKZ332]|nr:hypothetical protein FO519_003677 [Halicephalobus sp. NKZ332]
MTVFNGIVKIRVVEARDLRPTEWSKRFNNSDSQTPLLDTYVNVDCDEVHVGQTVTKPKTSTPVWNEDYKDLKPKIVNDIWVDLEPHGKLHLMIELQGSFTEG